MIYTARGLKVMLDRDLSQLYGVETRALNQAVKKTGCKKTAKRNQKRFPDDFMFQLTHLEWESLRSQTVIIENKGRGYHLNYIPYVFTEQGIKIPTLLLSGLTKGKWTDSAGRWDNRIASPTVLTRNDMFHVKHGACRNDSKSGIICSQCQLR